MMEAKEEVTTTLFTLGALFLIDLRMPVVPITAGSRRSFWISVALKWKGEAVCKTASNGGSEITALSKAPSWAISSTREKSSLSLPTFGWASLILLAFSWERTVVMTEWPCSKRMSRTWAAMKPEPPVRRTRVMFVLVVWKLLRCQADGFSASGNGRICPSFLSDGNNSTLTIIVNLHLWSLRLDKFWSRNDVRVVARLSEGLEAHTRNMHAAHLHCAQKTWDYWLSSTI